MTKITYIPGEIANAAIDEHGNRKPVTRTHHIFDDAKDKNQAEVNAEVDDTFAFHQSEINALNSQNYVTVDSFSSLPATGAVDTVYRVSNWDGTQQDPTVYSEYAWNGEDYVHLSTKTQIGEVFDISAYHATGGVLAKYADLSAALDSNNGGGVPQSLQKGGMSVKYVRSSDNKYVQARCMAQNFTTDTTQWSIADEGIYVENPEFVYVKTDDEGKILFGIKVDGEPYFGVGCPEQVKEYVEQKIADLSLDEYEDIVTFLSDYLGGDTTLKAIIGEWNNAVPGKKISILGDSISTFNQEGYKIDGYAMYYPTAAGDRGADVTTVNDTWWMQVINSVAGTLEVNASYSGSTASSRTVGFSPRVPLLGNPDIIYIALGTNDSGQGVTVGEINFEAETYDLTQFAPAYIKGMQDTIAAYPKAKIVCVAFDMGTDYQNAIKTIAENYGAEYIYVGDISDVHPNKAEMTAAANRIITSSKYTITDAIKNLSNGKVDKETGKSLIDAEYASSQSAIDNPEFLEVTTDSEDKVLEGIQKNGTKVIGGDLKVLGNIEVSGVLYKVVESLEYLAAWVDAEGKVIFGLKTDGKTYVGDADFLNEIKNNQEAINEIKSYLANFDNIDIDALSSITAIENPEYIEAKTDSENKILAGRTSDGAAFENVGFSTPKVSIDGHTIENIKDPEGRSEVTTDSEGKIISYRDNDGVKHENVGIETKQVSSDTLVLSDDGLSDLAKTLKEHGFINDRFDWSDAKELHIAEPRCAIINFKGITDVPTTKTADAKAIMEFWDMQGNYFKKETIVNAQGNSTLFHPKRGMTVDICNNNGWDDEDTFKLQIGNWVPQDSFHVKAYYADPFRCVSAIAYKLMDEVLKTRGEFDDYVWKKALLDLDSITATSNGASTAEDTEKQFTNGARCISDGFPCIVYMEGEFYGIYAWQLKKHRDNYQMSKKKAKHIHLDGVLGLDTFFGIDDFDWTWFEVRNPKNLVYAEAHNDLKGNPTYKYDADDAGQFEIAGNHDGSTTYDTWTAGSYVVNKVVLHNSHYFLNTIDGNTAEPIYDSKNNSDDAPDFKNKTGCGWLNVTNTIKVKEYVIKLSELKGTLETALATYNASSKTAEDLATFREAVEEYLDPDSMIDYYIVSEVLNNYDGFRKNWQWITYDGKKWYIVMWDCDGCLGNWWELIDRIIPPLTAHIYTGFPYNCILAGWDNELKERYAELRDASILSEHHITGMIREWHGRLGNKNTFDKEWERWPGFIKNDSIFRVSRWLTVSISNMDIIYNYNQN